jgi:hypothetical protein
MMSWIEINYDSSKEITLINTKNINWVTYDNKKIILYFNNNSVIREITGNKEAIDNIIKLFKQSEG